jgi:hypothetical protein
MSIKIYYPWTETEVGQSFFMPSLDVYKTKEAGLVVALHLYIKGKATFGLLHGKHGVLFTRLA